MAISNCLLHPLCMILTKPENVENGTLFSNEIKCNSVFLPVSILIHRSLIIKFGPSNPPPQPITHYKTIAICVINRFF